MLAHCRRLLLLASLCLATALNLNAAGLSLTGTVTPQVGAFLYELEIANAGPDDYSVVSIVDAPAGDALIAPSLTTPAGFLGSYDGGLGIIDFIEFTDLFAAGTSIGGFSFQSLTGPVGAFSMFEAVSTLGDFASGDITWTVRPGPSVPEPVGGLAVSLAVGIGLLGAARRRRLSGEIR
jgi:hypothetical protein